MNRDLLTALGVSLIMLCVVLLSGCAPDIDYCFYFTQETKRDDALIAACIAQPGCEVPADVSIKRAYHSTAAMNNCPRQSP